MANTDGSSPTYNYIAERLANDDDPYASLFGYTVQVLKMVTAYPTGVFREQALDIIRAVDDHDARVRAEREAAIAAYEAEWS